MTLKISRNQGIDSRQVRFESRSDFECPKSFAAVATPGGFTARLARSTASIALRHRSREIPQKHLRTSLGRRLAVVATSPCNFAQSDLAAAPKDVDWPSLGRRCDTLPAAKAKQVQKRWWQSPLLHPQALFDPLLKLGWHLRATENRLHHVPRASP